MEDIQKIKEFFSKPLEEDFGQALFNRLNPKDEDLEAIVNILIQDPKIRKSPDQASFKEALENYIRFNSDRNSIGQAAVRALSYRNTGGRYGSGFDRIFNMLVDKNNLSEAKTDINKIKKRLDALGIKYEMSATDKVRPFKVIYKPVDKSDEFYDKFEDIVDLFNLKSFVKSFMNEVKKEDKVEFKKGNTVFDKHTKAKLKVTRIVKDRIYTVPFNFPGRAEEWYKAEDLTTKSFFTEQEEDVVDTITMDVPLFIRMLEYSREDAAEDMDLHDVTEKAIALNKEKSILSMDDYDAIVGGAEEVNENKGIDIGDIVSKKYASTEEDYTKEFKVIGITGMSATLQDTKTGKKIGVFLNDISKVPMKEATSDYMKRRKAQDDYVVNKKDKPAKSYNPTPSGKTDYMKRREKELAEAVFAKLKK